MTTPAWPSWLTGRQVRRIQSLGGFTFVWTIRTQPSCSAAVVHGQWARNATEEINVALRAAPDESFVAVYPRGQGFWHDGREPEMTDALTAATGPLGQMLDLAEAWAKDREPPR